MKEKTGGIIIIYDAIRPFGVYFYQFSVELTMQVKIACINYQRRGNRSVTGLKRSLQLPIEQSAQECDATKLP